MMRHLIALSQGESRRTRNPLSAMSSERAECDERRAEILTFAVFQELRDRLTPDEAAKVAAQLPTSLKMLWMFS